MRRMWLGLDIFVVAQETFLPTLCDDGEIGGEIILDFMFVIGWSETKCLQGGLPSIVPCDLYDIYNNYIISFGMDLYKIK